MAGMVPAAGVHAGGRGAYIGLEGGGNRLEHQRLDLYGDDGSVFGGVIPDGTEVANFQLEDGYHAAVDLGYAMDFGLRPELELLYRSNNLDKDRFVGTDLEGKERLRAAMGNLWFDFFKSSSFRPYIGGGAGYAQIRFHDARTDVAQFANDHDEQFAWQAGAGFNADLSEHLALGLGYRYFKTDRADFDLTGAGIAARERTRYEAHTALLSLTLFFGSEEVAPVPPAEPAPVEVVPVVVEAAPPSPPPPPPPAVVCKSPEKGQPMTLEGCKSGDKIVLRGVNFEFNKSTLTANARTLLDSVAEELNKRPEVSIELDGFTDAKGSDAYNQNLSQRRAQSVRQYLTTRGVAATRMTAVGMGESNPIADNESDAGRELNRRVELKVTSGGEGVTVAPPAGSN